jgi:guanylate kinase
MIIILCAPSGSGKSTMVQHLLTTYPGKYELSISATTRPPRGQEQHGKEYYFISREEFEKHIQNNDFIEYEQVYEGLYYGTLKAEIERIQSAGRTIVFDIDVKGGLNLKRIFGEDALAIFIAPPSVEELSRRLHVRGDTSKDMIEKRLAKAEIEMADAPYFDKIIVNDDLTTAKAHLDQEIAAGSQKNNQLLSQQQ